GGAEIGSVNLISPEYFVALRIPLLQGRIWSDAENNKGAHVAVINRALAQRYFPNGDAIGHSLRSGGLEGNPATVLSPPNIGATWFQIVGIVGDARNDGLRSAPTPSVYVPYTFSMGEGAQRADVLRMVVRATSVSLGAGILAGIALSLALNQIVAKWAQGNPRDPVILLAGSILLGLVSGLACAIPARRASKVDPMIALR